MLSRVFDFGQADGEGFEDVLPDSWWYNAVLSAQSVGIINGYDGRFMPYSSIKRQDAVVMIYRALLACGKAEAAPSEENSFKDGSSVSGYARTAVTALSEMGVIQGYNGYFRPNDTITRAEAAALIYRVKSL